MKAVRNNAGMTLIEIMIVLAIIGGLVAILGGDIIGQFNKSKTKTARVQMGEISKALQGYTLDCGSLPGSDAGLQALVEAPSSGCRNWGPNPYIKKNLLLDPWGNEFIYEKNSSSSYTILSFGADGIEGGDGLDADISSNDEQ